ncbi:MAG TPA: ribonuclease D [Actinomycetota bacterium]|nr:ribonuclease D [Actinomycetota bacterium]
MTPLAVAEVEFVTEPKDLEESLQRCRAAGWVALDTEFWRERTYRSRLCLAQLAVEDTIYLVDPMAGLDMSGVAALVADPDVEIILHSGGQDLELFHEHWGVIPKGIFDVQRAAGFAGYGASLAYGALVKAVLGVSLTKGESYTDWCRRPLTQEQLSYAADDVRYLPAMAAHLKEKLAGLGRTEWVDEEMRAIEATAGRDVDAESAWRKVGGRGSLSRAQNTVLRELAWWREQSAARRDVPRGWVIKDVTLTEIARRSPSTKKELMGVRGMNPKEVERSGDEIIAAVARGKTSPPIELAPTPSKNVQMRARMLAGIADALLRARCEAGHVASELVATRAQVEALLAAVISGGDDVPKQRLQQGWRKALAGDAIVDLARGRIALKVIGRPPYVQEVPLGASDACQR